MTEAERTRLRELQNAWLALPVVQNQIRGHGWNQHIGASPSSPTFAEVRDVLFPAWERWFADFIEDAT